MNDTIKRMNDAALCDLIRESKDDKNSAFDEIYRRYSKRIYVYLRKMLGSDPELEDVFQETFLRFLKYAENNPAPDNTSAYIYKIAGNLSINRVNKQKRDTRVFEYVEDYERIMGDESYAPAENEEITRITEKALELIPEEMKQAFLMQNYLGLKYEEIGEIIGKPVSTVRNRIVRAKAKLKTILAPYYGAGFKQKVKDE